MTNILVVEDEGIIAMDLAKRLEDLGYAVSAMVATGEDAIAQTLRLQPDLILMDVVLRGTMDGIQAAAQIRTQMNVPIIYLTAHSDEHTLARAKLTEPHGYILKPFDDRELHSAIEMALYKYAAEQHLRESEERFRALADSAPVMIWMADVQGQCNFVNKPWLEFTGRTLTEELGVGWAASLHPDDLDRYGKMVSTAFSAREPFTCEYRLRRADGVYRWVMNMGMPRWLSNHEFAGYVGSAMDVTEQREAHDALAYRLAWEKLVATISSNLINLPSGSLDTEITNTLGMLGDFVHADRCYLLQLSEDDSELRVTQHWRAADVEAVPHAVLRIPATAVSWAIDELRHSGLVHISRVADLPPAAHKEKQILQVFQICSLVAVPLAYQNRLYGLLGLGTQRVEMQWADEDIKLLKTMGEMLSSALARQRSEQALRQSEERWRMYIQDANDLIFGLDASGQVTLANRAACVALGYSLTELLGKSPLNFIVPEDQLYVKSVLRRIYVGDDVDMIEISVMRKDGRRMLLEVRGRSFSHNNQIIGTLHIARDVTERRQATLRLEYLSTHDALTNLYNRLFFEEELKRMEHSRYLPVSVLMCDVNGLKAMNDHNGHTAGDDLLRRAADVLREAFRTEDIVARIGGDEFVALLPNTNHEQAELIVQRVRQRVEEHNQNNSPALSLAMGVATASEPGTLLHVLQLADSRMYIDKRRE